MMANNLELRVVFQAIDRFVSPVRSISRAAGEASRALKENRDRIKELGRTMAQLDAFKKAQRDAAIAANSFHATQARIAALRAEIERVGVPTKAMARQMEAASREADRLRDRHQALMGTQQRLFERLRTAGIDTSRLADEQRRLANEQTHAAQETRGLSQALEVQNQRMRRINDARRQLDRSRETAGKFATAGAGLMVAGGAMAAPVKGEIDEARRYALEIARIQALGLGDKASKDAVKFAESMKTYGTSTRENLELMRDAMTVFADEHHAQMVAPTLAKMKFANAAMYGDEGGADNSRKFIDMLKVIELRGGLASEARFKHEADMIQQVITATGGRVGPEQWIDFIKTGGLAAKGLDEKAFFYRMEPLIQEMKGHAVGTGLMSAYQNLYQGKTTVRAARYAEELGLYDKSMVEYDKVGQLKRVKPGALKGGDLFKSNPMEWMNTVMLPALAAKGITNDKEITDAIGSIFSNRKASDLFATMYLQRAQIDKSARLNSGADGIDALNDKAMKTAQGGELDLLAKKHDLYLEMGKDILPLYVQGLEFVRDAIKGLTTWMKENPGLAKAVSIGLAGIAAAALAIGAIMVSIGAVIVPLATLKFAFTTLGISGFSCTAMLVKGFKLIVSAISFVGRALLMNPIGLAITAIVVAAYLIYKYWDPIKAFFKDLWAEAKAAFDGGIGGITKFIINWSPIGLFYRAFAAVMRYFGFELPDRLTDYGGGIINSITGGITAHFQNLWSALTSVGQAILSWSQDNLGFIIQYWGPVKDFYVGLWNDVNAAFSGGITGVSALVINWSPIGLFYRAFAAVMDYLGIELPTKFSDAGKAIIDGIVNGLTANFGRVKDAITNIADSTVGWLKEKLGIHSPSRVFAELGGFTIQGFEDGLRGGEEGPIDAVGGLAKKLVSIAGGVAIGGTAIAGGIQFDARPPISPAAMMGAMGGGDTYNITINAPAGTDSAGLAALVRREIARIEAEKASRRRSRLSDAE